MAEFFADRRQMSASAAYEFDKEIDPGVEGVAAGGPLTVALPTLGGC
jgi:hypothetical protein